MHSPYGIELNTTNKRSKNVSNTNIDKNSHGKHEHKQSQMILNEP